MSAVALFFQDSRIQAALTGPRSAAVPSLIDAFFAAHDYNDCSPDQLLTLADLATRCGRAEIAAAALRRVIATGARPHVAHYRLGRLLLAQGAQAEAAAEFDLGAAANPDFAFNHMGAARARAEMGRPVEAVPFAERFAAFGLRPHSPEDLTVLADLAAVLAGAGEADRAAPIYALLQKFGGDAARPVVRQAEARIAAGDYAGAGTLLRDQIVRTGPDPWLRRALALCLSHEGAHDSAIANAREALQADPSNPGFLGTFVRVVGRSGDAAAIRDALANLVNVLSAADTVELTVRMRVAEADIESAARTLLAEPVAPDGRLFNLTLEIAYAAIATDVDFAVALASALHEAAPDDMLVQILRVDIAFRQLHWEKAGAILATLPQTAGERPQLTMKRLEHASFTGDAAAAAAAAAQLQGRPGGNPILMLPVFRHYAEQQNWHAVVDHALPWLHADLNYAQIGYVLFRAARNTSRHAEFLAAIQAISDWAARPGLVTLRNTLLCDQVRTAGDADALLMDPMIAANPIISHRLALQRDVFGPPLDGTGRHAVFLCTDRNYLCATVVALHSLTRGAPARAVDFFLVVDDDIVALAESAVAAYKASGISITVMPATAIVGSADRLFPAYGLFTSGHRLASAAYYRIYFGKYLKGLGRYTRALYVDGDVLLHGSLDSLFRLNLAGKPLGARLETPRPDVWRAIAHHHLAEGQYFNSGVLLLDLRHPGLEAALDASVDAIADETIRLLYHDQCALNLGFRDRFAAIDIRWNFPVNEDTGLADIPPDAAILHFLARPKPWSAAYGGAAGPLWFAKWRDTASVIGEDMAVRLLREIHE